MTSARLNVLFLCSGNSARSIMAEALLARLGRGGLKGFSAGTRPSGALHPQARALLEELGYLTDGLRSKSWQEFARIGAPPVDILISLCEQVTVDGFPVWPGQPVRAHWSIPDPRRAAPGQVSHAFSAAFGLLETRVRALTMLPVELLSRTQLADQLNAIDLIDSAPRRRKRA